MEGEFMVRPFGLGAIPRLRFPSGPAALSCDTNECPTLTLMLHFRYFILTRDYLNCFKRATGSASEKISDMGQFIFKIKLVDVEKVEWLNRRSYSAIGLLLGSREGRVLLRSDQGLEDWFELLEECTLSSKERRRALRLTQGPRSRASLAAPVSAASLQSNHLGLGGTYSGAIEDWLLSRNQRTAGPRFNHILLSDSVPDLSSINENAGLCSGMLTNHSTPKKVPNARHNLSGGSSHGYSSHNGSLYNGFPYSPLKKLADNFVNGNHSYTLHDDLEEEVELRRGGRYRENDDLYRRPHGPGANDSSRHSFLTDLDYAGADSDLDTPPSTHRPSSCRDNIYFAAAYNGHAHGGSGFLGKDKTTDTGISSSRGTLVSPASSIRHGYVNVASVNNNHLNSYGSRYSVQEQKILRARNGEDNKNSIRSVRAEFFEQSKYNSSNGSGHHQASNNNHITTGHSHPNGNNNNGGTNGSSNGGINAQQPNYHQHANGSTNGSNGNIHQLHFNGLNNNNGTGGHHHPHPHHSHHHHQLLHQHQHSNSVNNNVSGAPNGSGTGSQRDRYQHPALAAIINESQGMKFRDRSYSDCQQAPRARQQWTSNTPSPKRIPFLGTPPTRV
ncbi:AGAP009666-PA-like protein [Anopheles sinensis]|uniref:AGAP009666-PA-like protein n=1 Tax=Anopheles sinensis TaxID=74873 RepID=A0A084VSK6_ANOSI|nr:AGAP009666-PA-like protein [Anopheles sinensis]